MRKIVINEEQEKHLIKLLKEETYQMPVDKKMNKPYCINPDNVLIVKKFLDKTFECHDWENVGANGLPCVTKIFKMKASNGEPLKWMYKDQLLDLLEDHFQHMFSDHLERSLFMSQVLKDWMNGKIGVHGTLTTNFLAESVSSEDVTAEANNANTEPSDAQKEAGNYKMGHVSVKGMKISIENPAGSYRKYKDENGNEGTNLMKNHYGYFNITKGKDGDAVDVFFGPNIENFENVYCVDQNKSDGSFDETKVMLGFDSSEEAKRAYLDNYSPDWKGFRDITGVSLKLFKKWLYRGRKQRQPFADYVEIQKKKLNESQINEEEYSEIRRVARAWDPETTENIINALKEKGIDAYVEDGIINICVERSTTDDHYVDDIENIARQIVRQNRLRKVSEPSTSLAENKKKKR